MAWTRDMEEYLTVNNVTKLTKFKETGWKENKIAGIL